MTKLESAYHLYPGYQVALSPYPFRVRVWHDDLLLAESDRATFVDETKHVPRIYLPFEDIRLELFTETEHHTICPFKGEADYWSVTATDPPLENVLWAYRTPFEEVAGLAGQACFYDERVRVEVESRWPGDELRDVSRNRFPVWGDAADLLRIIDVEAAGDDRYVSPPYPTKRNVVEGSQMLGQAVVAASKAVPGQRVVSAHMLFPKAADFDHPLEFAIDRLRVGRTFSTLSVRVGQDDKLRSAGLVLLDAGAPDVISSSAPMPDVAGPYEAEPYDMGVTNRDVRVVDGAYTPRPEQVGPPELYAWVRFRDAPAAQHLHQGLMAQFIGHLTVAASMRPHEGLGEADAHVTLSTGIMGLTITFHDDVAVDQWMLYANPVTYAGRGLAQGEGRIYTEDGRLVASYSVQAMVRGFATDPSALGLDASNAM